MVNVSLCPSWAVGFRAWSEVVCWQAGYPAFTLTGNLEKMWTRIPARPAMKAGCTCSEAGPLGMAPPCSLLSSCASNPTWMVMADSGMWVTLDPSLPSLGLGVLLHSFRAFLGFAIISWPQDSWAGQGATPKLSRRHF